MKSLYYAAQSLGLLNSVAAVDWGTMSQYKSNLVSRISGKVLRGC